MTTITLCMIVRDEEAMLAACIESARPAVDDIVVVDTGSSDATRHIASGAGARVFEFPWCDDFAAARNESLRHARGKWVLILDADERLAPGSDAAIRAAVANAAFDCGMVRLHDATRIDAPLGDVVSGRERQAEVQLVPRVLRRAGGLTFVDPIHENVAPWLSRRGKRVAGVDADIVHLGATKQVVSAKSKTERNIRLLRIRVERDPGDVAAYGYLAHDLLRAGKPQEALDVAERGWSRVEGQSARSIHRLATARAYLLIATCRYGEARVTARRARALEGENPDFIFLEANASESEALALCAPSARRELLLSARDGYAACLRFANRVFAQAFVFGATSWCGATRLGTVELALGRPTEALSAFDLALAVRPDDRAARLGRAEAMIGVGDAAGALVRLEGLLDDTSADAWTLAAIAVYALGLLDDARTFGRRARALSAKTFVAAHRRERLRDLLQSLTHAAEVTGPGESARTWVQS